MGNALKGTVDGELSKVLEGGTSNLHIPFLGLGNTIYSVTGKNISPHHLGEGLYLSGSVDSMEFSTPTVAAGGSAFAGGSPPVSVTAQGIRVSVGNAVPENFSRKRDNFGESSGFKDMLASLANLSVDIRDAVVELKLAGHDIVLYMAHVKTEPQKQGRSAAKWLIKHTGIHLDLDGKRLIHVKDGSGMVDLAQALRRADLDFKTEIVAGLDVEQVIALLDVVAACLAISAVAGSLGKTGSSETISNIPLSLKWLRTSMRLTMNDSPLIAAECKQGSLSVDSSKAEIQVQPMEVQCTGTSKSTSEMVRICAQKDNRLLAHSFPAEQDGVKGLPWKGTLEFLLDDPRFAQHKGWLEAARDLPGVDVTSLSTKRPLDDSSGSGGGNPEMKRSRVV